MVHNTKTTLLSGYRNSSLYKNRLHIRIKRRFCYTRTIPISGEIESFWYKKPFQYPDIEGLYYTKTIPILGYRGALVYLIETCGFGNTIYGYRIYGNTIVSTVYDINIYSYIASFENIIYMLYFYITI